MSGAANLTFDLVGERFKRLDMELITKVKDTLGHTWKYGSVYGTRAVASKPGCHFYANLEQANQHAREIAWIRGIEREDLWS